MRRVKKYDDLSSSRQYGLTADTLRYYEKIGLIPFVSRTSGGVRDYGEESCRWVELMKCFRQAGVHIDALVKYAELYRAGEILSTSERKFP